MLTGNEIVRRLGEDIIITPFTNEQLNPNSYNVKLHNELLVYDNNTDCTDLERAGSNEPLDMKKDNPTRKITIPNEGLVLEPNKLYLGRTVEYTETRNLIPCINGRSSIGRLGISIHATAGYGDIGFKGTWTLEIFCIEPVKIYPFIEIAQIYYFEPAGNISMQYKGKYLGQVDATESRMYKDLK